MGVVMKIRDEITKLDRYSLKVLLDFVDISLASMCPDEQNEWEMSPFGVDMMHVKVRFYGLHFDNMYHIVKEAPHDWAWQIVGELGDGYRNITPLRVLRCLIRNNWVASDKQGQPVELVG
jgi:hypothetical protein